jgi:hypothetical protein
MVFVVGGNGGNAAANAIQEEVEACGVKCVVAGVPKSIDNDILLVGGGGGGGGVCPALGVRVCWCGVWVCVVGGGAGRWSRFMRAGGRVAGWWWLSPFLGEHGFRAGGWVLFVLCGMWG